MGTDQGFAELVPLGSGPMATVYAGHRARTGEAVALKVLDGRVSKRTRQEVVRELARLRPLREQAPVLVADSVEEVAGGRTALCMELCTQSLTDLIATDGPLSGPDALALAGSLAAAVRAAHAAGVVHGGVTPGNVLFRPSGEPVLSDFGTSLRRAFPREPGPEVDFLAPETLRDGTLDERSDLYGLGAVLYLALSGHSPHPAVLGEEPDQRVLRVLGTPVPRLTRSDLPEGLAEVVAALLAKDPALRPTDSATLAGWLDAMVARLSPGTPAPATYPAAHPTAFDDFVPAPRPVAPHQPSPHQATPQQAAPHQATPQQATPHQAAPQPNAPQPVAPQLPAPQPTAPHQVAPEQAAPQLSAPQQAAPQQAPPQPVVRSDSAFDDFASAPPAPGPAPRPQGDPVFVSTPESARRKYRHALPLVGGAGALLLLVAAGVALLRSDPESLDGLLATTPPSTTRAPTPTKAVQMELVQPVDRVDSVELSWRSSEQLDDYAVVVAADGEEAKTYRAQGNLTMTIPVDPTRQYCFLVQGTDGRSVWTTAPKPLRGAKCKL